MHGVELFFFFCSSKLVKNIVLEKEGTKCFVPICPAFLRANFLKSRFFGTFGRGNGDGYGNGNGNGTAMIPMQGNRSLRVHQNLNLEYTIENEASRPRALHSIEYSVTDLIATGSFYKVYRGNFRGFRDVVIKVALVKNGGRRLAENEIRMSEGFEKSLQGDLAIVHGSNFKSSVFKQTLEAYKFLHSKSILHRDVRAKNIFVEEG